MTSAPRVERWSDRGGRTNRATLVRADRGKPGDVIRYERQVTVIFTPEEWVEICKAVLSDLGLSWSGDFENPPMRPRGDDA